VVEILGAVGMRTWMIVVGVGLLVTLVLAVAVGLQALNPPPEIPTPSLTEGDFRVERVASVPPVVATRWAQAMEREPWRDGSREIRMVTSTAEAEP